MPRKLKRTANPPSPAPSCSEWARANIALADNAQTETTPPGSVQPAGSVTHLRHEVRASISWDTAMQAVCCMARDGAPQFFAPYDAQRLERAASNIWEKLAPNTKRSHGANEE